MSASPGAQRRATAFLTERLGELSPCPASANAPISSNATVQAVNQTQDYFSVFEEVSKNSIHLNIFERLWVVRTTIDLSKTLSRCTRDTWHKVPTGKVALTLRYRAGTCLCKMTLSRRVS